MHTLTERLDRGEDVVGGPYQADLDAYRDTLTKAGLSVRPEWVECRMVCDSLQLAGTVDRIVVAADGRNYIADLKTSATVDFGALGWSAQLAAYAHSDLYDPASGTRLPTPAIDRTVGFIIHLPAGKGTCTLHDVDLVQGYRAAMLANEVRAMRKAAKGWLAAHQPVVLAALTPAEQHAAIDALDGDGHPDEGVNITEHGPNSLEACATRRLSAEARGMDRQHRPGGQAGPPRLRAQRGAHHPPLRDPARPGAARRGRCRRARRPGRHRPHPGGQGARFRRTAVPGGHRRRGGRGARRRAGHRLRPRGRSTSHRWRWLMLPIDSFTMRLPRASVEASPDGSRSAAARTVCSGLGCARHQYNRLRHESGREVRSLASRLDDQAGDARPGVRALRLRLVDSRPPPTGGAPRARPSHPAELAARYDLLDELIDSEWNLAPACAECNSGRRVIGHPQILLVYRCLQMAQRAAEDEAKRQAQAQAQGEQR